MDPRQRVLRLLNCPVLTFDPLCRAVWNPDSVDTGGLLTADWRTISWSKVDLLSKLGLKPWYKWAKMDRGRKLALR